MHPLYDEGLEKILDGQTCEQKEWATQAQTNICSVRQIGETRDLVELNQSLPDTLPESVGSEVCNNNTRGRKPNG